jgi:hypothetical protein
MKGNWKSIKQAIKLILDKLHSDNDETENQLSNESISSTDGLAKVNGIYIYILSRVGIGTD